LYSSSEIITVPFPDFLLIIRVSWLFSTLPGNFFNPVLNSLKFAAIIAFAFLGNYSGTKVGAFYGFTTLTDNKEAGNINIKKETFQLCG
jgi:hypothetical protein